jgi:hypothetical protein
MVMCYLWSRQFKTPLDTGSQKVKAGVNLTITRLRQRDALGMVHYYWTAVTGTERSVPFAKLLKSEGFPVFETETTLFEFRDRFNDKWFRSAAPAKCPFCGEAL